MGDSWNANGLNVGEILEHMEEIASMRRRLVMLERVLEAAEGIKNHKGMIWNCPVMYEMRLAVEAIHVARGDK